jgi:hypothetical protein
MQWWKAKLSTDARASRQHMSVRGSEEPLKISDSFYMIKTV